ncbi:MAG: hypothetical protein V4727_05815 [Verrucomicrobiota bacterium]
MRPLLPQSKFNFSVLLKLVAIYGFITLIVLLCVVVVAFAVSESDELKEDFVGKDIDFIWMISRSPLLTVLAPFGAGGVLGVLHYIFVRRRSSDIQTIEESLESEANLNSTSDSKPLSR